MPSTAAQPRHRRYTVRWQARLDAETHTKLQELAQALRRKQAPIVRHVMQWALAHTHGWTIDQSIPSSPHPVTLLVQLELLQQVQDAAAAHGASVAAWVRQAMRQVTLEDFPPSWRAGDSATRSHDSGYHHNRFMLRLDDDTQRKLGTLTHTFHRPAAEVIRQLIAQAQPQDFPESWHLAVREHRQERES